MSTSHANTRVHHPERISPEDLDQYLEDGWYRIGQAMVSCRYVWSPDGALRSAIWTRTRLEGYSLKKSHRKLMARNLARFNVTEGPLRPDGEHEALYRRYLKVARGERPPRLYDALMGGHFHDRFHSRELAIRDQAGRLVGFSAFDLGHRSLQSLMGVYDPELGPHSLGFWSLLLEVRHALSRGLDFHYSGYVLPGDPSMDYKLRVGQMEFLHPDHHAWEPWSEFSKLELPVDRLERSLRVLSDALTASGVPNSIQSYRLYEAPAWNPQLGAALQHPRVVVLYPDRGDPTLDLLTYDVDADCFILFRCVRAEARAESRGDDAPRQVELWIEVDRRVAGGQPAPVADAIAAWRRRGG